MTDAQSDGSGGDGGDLGRWAPLPSTGAPTPRAGHTAVWTGSEMIVWGGQAGRPNYLVEGNGGVLDVATGLWRGSPRPAGVSPRMDHVAGWIASRMWIWGGTTDEGDTEVGEQGAWYRPDTESWSIPAAAGDVPQGRSGPVAVWTGTRLIVWGGGTQALPGYLADGGVYDPANDTWMSMTGVGAPAGRYAAAAVWTGARMIVWGGSGDPAAALSGGSYDPAADRWYPISSVGAPEIAFPIAVYTGRAFVVWGQSPLRGVLTSGSQAVGGAYDPERDIWRPITLGGSPSTRAWATAVWTGRFMIVWGGRSSDGQNLADGARYDPSADAWVPLPVAGAPEGRVRHTAVWTGQAMLIWGGTDTANIARGDGAAYYLP